MSRDHLQPTPTVDKNGRSTIVYKRGPESADAAGNGRRIPSPAVVPHVKRDPDETLLHILETILPVAAQDNRQRLLIGTIADELKADGDAEYLGQVLDLVRLVDGEDGIEKADDFEALLPRINTAEKDHVRLMHHYLDDFAAAPGFMGTFVMMAEELRRYGITPNADGDIPTIESHLYARLNYRPNSPALRGSKRRYHENRRYVELVEKYADQVDHLSDYVHERGLKNFSDDAFEAYLAQGALASGTL